MIDISLGTVYAKMLGILAAPCVVLCKDGEPVKVIYGERTEDGLLALLEAHDG